MDWPKPNTFNNCNNLGCSGVKLRTINSPWCNINAKVLEMPRDFSAEYTFTSTTLLLLLNGSLLVFPALCNPLKEKSSAVTRVGFLQVGLQTSRIESSFGLIESSLDLILSNSNSNSTSSSTS